MYIWLVFISTHISNLASFVCYTVSICWMTVADMLMFRWNSNAVTWERFPHCRQVRYHSNCPASGDHHCRKYKAMYRICLTIGINHNLWQKPNESASYWVMSLYLWDGDGLGSMGKPARDVRCWEMWYPMPLALYICACKHAISIPVYILVKSRRHTCYHTIWIILVLIHLSWLYL